MRHKGRYVRDALPGFGYGPPFVERQGFEPWRTGALALPPSEARSEWHLTCQGAGAAIKKAAWLGGFSVSWATVSSIVCRSGSRSRVREGADGARRVAATCKGTGSPHEALDLGGVHRFLLSLSVSRRFVGRSAAPACFCGKCPEDSKRRERPRRGVTALRGLSHRRPQGVKDSVPYDAR